MWQLLGRETMQGTLSLLYNTNYNVLYSTNSIQLSIYICRVPYFLRFTFVLLFHVCYSLEWQKQLKSGMMEISLK